MGKDPLQKNDVSEVFAQMLEELRDSIDKIISRVRSVEKDNS